MRRFASSCFSISALLMVADLLGCNGVTGHDAGASHQEDGATGDAAADAAGLEGPSCEATGCTNGLFFGTCDGEWDTPVLACNETTGRCRWYLGGCPSGHRASDCSPNDICCHDSGDGPWPFAAWTPASDMASTELALDVAAMGDEIVTRVLPADTMVVVDPIIGPPDTDTRVTCSPGAPLQICDDGIVRVPVVYGTEESLVLWFSSRERLSESLLLEVVSDASGSTIGRVFVRDFTDATRPGAPRLCVSPHREVLSGTARLSTVDRFVDVIHGVLELSLVDGHRVMLEF